MDKYWFKHKKYIILLCARSFHPVFRTSCSPSSHAMPHATTYYPEENGKTEITSWRKYNMYSSVCFYYLFIYLFTCSSHQEHDTTRNDNAKWWWCCDGSLWGENMSSVWNRNAIKTLPSPLTENFPKSDNHKLIIEMAKGKIDLSPCRSTYMLHMYL